MTPLAATSGSSVGQDGGGVALHDDAGVAPSAIWAAASSTPASSKARTGAMPGRRPAGERAQAIELQTAQVGAAPLLIGPRRHRERFVELPGAAGVRRGSAPVSMCAREMASTPSRENPVGLPAFAGR